MGDKNPLHTLGDYSRPSHEGYRNTIELPEGNNVVPLRSDTIRLVQNGCSFHGLRSKDPNQHLKDFLKLVDSLDLDGENRERTRRQGPEQACVDYASSHTNEIRGKKFTSNHGPRNLNDVANTWKDKPNFNRAHTQTFTSPQGGSISVHSSSYQMKLEKALLDFDSNQEKSDMEEEDASSTNACNLDLGGMAKGKEELKEQGMEENEMEADMEVEEEESEFETDEEIEEITEEEEDDGDGEYFNSFPTMMELTHHEWLLKNPRPPWVKTRIKTRSQNNTKLSCMIKTVKPQKISNFVGRIRGLKIFIGSFTYECDFMILEDTTSSIDRHLGEMVFGKPFIDKTGLVYDEEKGTIMFEQGDGKITFKMPYTMEIFKQIGLMGLSTDSIPLSAHEENFRHGKTHYYQSLLIRNE
ncbi:hypothetical protein Tco_0628674 [Tanacetum coccineum]|uniref:MAK10-like protein n=1 Tax=Tanacetum coccineum TaxID=301880 RepID=A0ABQ4WR21_9ASTR